MLRIFRVAFFAIFGVFFASPLFPVKNAQCSVISGTTEGLFYTTTTGEVLPLWTDGEVYKIIQGNIWFILTSEGIFSSPDFKEFTSLNTGLPVNIIKEADGGEKKFTSKTQSLKDLELHPENPEILVTATKDAVYLSRNSGKTWANMGSTARTSSIKAVAAANMKNPKTGANELVLFMSHAVYGFSYSLADAPKPQWTDVKKGFETIPTVGYADELSDILPVVRYAEDGSAITDIYASRSFKPQLYKFDWATKEANLLWQSTEPLDTIDGLYYADGSIFFTGQKGVNELNLKTLSLNKEPFYPDWWEVSLSNAPGNPQCAVFRPEYLNFPFKVHVSELWLLRPQKLLAKYAEQAQGKKGLYIPVNQIISEAGQNRYVNLIKSNRLNAAVIDMKDDFGLLRYNAKNPSVLEKARISSYNVNLETLIPKMKAENIYLIARIVVFKDKNLAAHGKGKYAIWDKKYNKSWQGIKNIPKEGETEYFDEHWVDPYSEDVWDYNVAIANELIARGFDEIQFDYIRFPTDGLNLANASYRWREHNMDMESALMSFLSHARKNIEAPLSIDIYGANGWYRSGTRTGQDVELLAQYVDVISPMFYPSHFEQAFLAYTPAEERPYRVYYYGTYRNAVISRNRTLIRPWAQAFYLPVSYDRTYYNQDYVQKQIFGTRDSVNQGYLYWNNSGRYDDIRPDIDTTTPYEGKSFEASKQFNKPALGGS